MPCGLVISSCVLGFSCTELYFRLDARVARFAARAVGFPRLTPSDETKKPKLGTRYTQYKHQ